MFFAFAILAWLSGVTSAHFRLLFPEPRGVFVADQEPNFCGGYNTAVGNRSAFPLSGGFFTIKAGHPDWTAGVLISTVQNPTTFDNFSVGGVQQFASPYAKENDAGTFCIPLNISAANIADVKDGANVTIQVVFAGGDGNLYQCADLTLSSKYTIPSNTTCSNTTVEATHSAEAPGASQTAGSLGRRHRVAGYTASILGLASVTLILL